MKPIASFHGGRASARFVNESNDGSASLTRGVGDTWQGLGAWGTVCAPWAHGVSTHKTVFLYCESFMMSGAAGSAGSGPSGDVGNKKAFAKQESVTDTAHFDDERAVGVGDVPDKPVDAASVETNAVESVKKGDAEASAGSDRKYAPAHGDRDASESRDSQPGRALAKPQQQPQQQPPKFDKKDEQRVKADQRSEALGWTPP